MADDISADDVLARQRIGVGGTEMSYVDVGEGDPIVFLHGNPTSSYLWRNVIPHLEPLGRCLAPDLIGMGYSGASPDGAYRFADHARYLDAWFEAVGATGRVTLVVHDWGSTLGVDWARRHAEAVKGIVYMEALLQPMGPAPEPDSMFGLLRSPRGEEMILEQNYFVEQILPQMVMRDLTEDEMAAYRRPYVEPGESRRATLAWPREVPFGGHPPDTTEIVTSCGEWLTRSQVPKLFINGDPGAILTGDKREFCRTFPNQQEVTVAGTHFLQEDSPHEIGRAVAEWYRAL